MAAKEPDKKGEDESMATSKQDPMLREHEKTYQGFMKLITYSTVAVVLVLALMALFLL